WVVLSACDTGAADGTGEGLSGLARGFFAAGARSVLVSHWSVDDRATEVLMSGVFARYASDRTLGKADAVRRGMISALESTTSGTQGFAHPFFWAPFFLVGDGGSGLVRE